METFNFDTTRPEPVAQATQVENNNPGNDIPDQDNTETEFVVTGSLSQAYTDALNKMLSGGKTAVITESLSQYAAVVKAAMDVNKPKPVLAYTTQISDLERDNLQAFDAITMGLDSGLFNRCVVCIEPDGGKYTDMGYALENYLIKRGVKIYRDRNKMLAAIGATNV